MKKILVMCIVLFLFLANVSLAQAANTPRSKLKRGFINVITAPLEIPKQTRIYWKEGAKRTMHISFWVFSGLVKGIVYAAARAGSGGWDVLTFPVAAPKNYDGLFKPDSVFQGWPDANKK